jgi:predicted transcriptional regulator
LQNKCYYFIFATTIVNNLQKMAKADKEIDLSFDFDFLNKLVVGIGEVSQITGIPTRQIRYWEDKGIITSLTEEEGKNRRYNYENIKKILLIKELMDEGYTLDASAEKVKKRMEMIEQTLNKLKKK